MAFYDKENPIKIIIADDHEVVLSGIKRILAYEDDILVIGSGRNGREAIDLVEFHKPDVLLIDIFMPIMNGVDAVKALKKTNAEVACVMLTAFEDAQHINDAITAGADGYLSKDISAKDLAQALRDVVAGNRVFSKSILSLMHGHLTMNNSKAVVLTNREQEVINLIAHGKKNVDIADVLSISYRTVENHRYNIIKKLNIKNSAELVRFAVLNSR